MYNGYLTNTFIPNFNNRFALNYKQYSNAYEKSHSKEKN